MKHIVEILIRYVMKRYDLQKLTMPTFYSEAESALIAQYIK